jgi:hypothetical protein
MGIISDSVVLIESVNGTGATVLDLVNKLSEEICQLQTMKEKIPQKWFTIRQLIKTSDISKAELFAGKPLYQKEEAISLLKSAGSVLELGLTDEKLWEVLEFWGMLGDVMVHRNVLVPDIDLFIELMRPILHHAPSESLKRKRSNVSGGKIDFDEIVIPKFNKLHREQQNKVEELIGLLETNRLLCFDVLQYMLRWEDLDESSRRDAIRVLEACYLLVGLSSPHMDSTICRAGSAGDDWLVTCRLSNSEKEALRLLDPSEVLGDASGQSLLFRAYASFVPDGFFSTLLATLVGSTNDQLMKTIRGLSSSNLHMDFQTLFGGDWDELKLRQVEIDGEGIEGTAIELWSTNLAMIKRVANEMEVLRYQKFPGIVFRYAVFFRNEKLQKGVLEWNIEQKYGSFGSILEERQEELPMSAKIGNVPGRILKMKVGDVIRPISQNAAFFLSHAWNDLSMSENATAMVTTGLQNLLEKRSGELVWLDKNEMSANETQYHSRMERGLRASSCVIVCLSRHYLTRRNCLLELAWAVKDYLATGKPIIVVSVDPELTLHSIQNWDTSKDLPVNGSMSNKIDPKTSPVCDTKPDLSADGTIDNDPSKKPVPKVDRRTIRFFQRHLTGVHFFEEWKDGEGARSEKREKAVATMLGSLSKWVREGRGKDPKTAPEIEVLSGGLTENDCCYIQER